MATPPRNENAGTAATGGTTAPNAAAPTLRYVDQPDCKEVFADSINNVYFDGQSLRVEFGITRLDDIKPNTPLSGRRYPAQRLVLTPIAAIELINRMQQVGMALTQAGMLKPTPPRTGTEAAAEQ